MSLDDACHQSELWRVRYISFRPHSSVVNLAPDEYRVKYAEAVNLWLCTTRNWGRAHRVSSSSCPYHRDQKPLYDYSPAMQQ